MTYKHLCTIGGGKSFAGYAGEDGIKLTYKTSECYRTKTIKPNLSAPTIDKTTKIYGETCLPICDFFVVCVNGKNKIKEGENANGF